MAQNCILCGERTNCTESCRECAKEIYDTLKEKSGTAELVPEEAIRIELGDGAFDLMREYNLIEYCATFGDTRMYAI